MIKGTISELFVIEPLSEKDHLAIPRYVGELIVDDGNDILELRVQVVGTRDSLTLWELGSAVELFGRLCKPSKRVLQRSHVKIDLGGTFEVVCKKDNIRLEGEPFAARGGKVQGPLIVGDIRNLQESVSAGNYVLCNCIQAQF